MDYENFQNDEGVQRALGKLDPNEYKYLSKYVQDNQSIAKADLYYSRVRIEWTVSTTTFTLPAATKVKAFQYGQADPMTSAGFVTNASSFNGTLIDTNLVSKGETNNGEVMLIKGVGFMLDPNVDPVLARRTLGHVNMSAGFGADDLQFKWGPLPFFPGGGGLYGGGISNLSVPNLGDSYGIIPGFTTNGVPVAGNFRDLDETLLWYPKGVRSADSNLSVVLQTYRAQTFTTAAARVAAAGVNAWTPPTTTGSEGTYVDGWVCLYGYQFGPRSKNR